jgi:hypothetical protein
LRSLATILEEMGGLPSGSVEPRADEVSEQLHSVVWHYGVEDLKKIKARL